MQITADALFNTPIYTPARISFLSLFKRHKAASLGMFPGPKEPANYISIFFEVLVCGN